MTDDMQTCANNDPRPTRLQLAWKEVKWRLYLLSLRLFYRRFSRTIHYFGMHRMKRFHLMGGDPFYRCDWCGMHGTKVETNGHLVAPRPSRSTREGENG